MKFLFPGLRWSLVLTVLVSVTACDWHDTDARETPVEKSEWSILQGVELTRRSDKITGPVFHTVDQYEVMGVSSVSGKHIWIMLKPMSPPYYKQIPEVGDYVLADSLVRQLVNDHRTSYTVEQVLKTHMREEK